MTSTYPLIQPSCANPQCRVSGKPLQTCSNCRLVLYCGKLCQRRHWNDHKADCKSPISSTDWRPQYNVQNREPSWKNWNPANEEQRKFVDKFERHDHCMYREIPAVDVLNLPDSEGLNVESMNILFATSGDLGTLIKTITSLPDDSSPHLRIYLNDKDEDVTVRNLILLLLAITSKDDLVTAECAVHYWYSQFIPEWCLLAISDQVRPLLKDIPLFSDSGDDKVGDLVVLLARIRARYALPEGCAIMDKYSAFNQPYSKTWECCDGGSLRMNINHELCLMIFMMLFAYDDSGPHPQIPNTPESLASFFELMKPWDGKYGNKDIWDEKLDTVTPAWRVAVKKYYEETIVVPFGHYRSADWRPNPNFLFVGGRRSMMRITSDPLNGWAIEEVKKADNGGAQNDVYGKLFYHARDQFRLFIKRLRTLTVNIEVHCKDVQALPTAFPGVKFDRIIVSDSTDDPAWDTQRMIQILSPLLKDKSVNPHAKVINETGCAYLDLMQP